MRICPFRRFSGTHTKTNRIMSHKDERTAALLRELEGEWSRRTAASIPAELFHYTSASGVIGILLYRNIWATSVDCLNDVTEGSYARELLLQHVQQRLEDPRVASDHTKEALALRKFHQELQQELRGALGDQGGFVACFCGSGDLLSQWRGYGGAAGFALGFSASGLENAPTPAVLDRVVYDSREQQELIQFAFGRVEAHLRALAAENPPDGTLIDDALDVALAYWFFCSRALLSFKHPAFAEESEWRLTLNRFDVAASNLEYRFFARGGGVVPYVALDLAKDRDSMPLETVVLGPGQELGAANSVDRLLSGYQKSRVTVRRSGIPYRDVYR